MTRKEIQELIHESNLHTKKEMIQQIGIFLEDKLAEKYGMVTNINVNFKVDINDIEDMKLTVEIRQISKNFFGKVEND